MLRVAEKHYAARALQSRHAHPGATVSIVLAGAVREQVGRAEEIGRALSVVVKPGGTEHADEFGAEGAHMLQILLDQASAASVLAAERRLAHWRWEHAGPAVPAFLQLLQAARRAGDAEGVERAAYDALAALTLTDAVAAPRAVPAWLRPVREAIDDGDEPPSVRALAAEAGVHPVHLARQFRRHLGCSVTEYVQRRRLQQAASRIASSGSALSAVACEAGYFDQAHMCRLVRRGTGMSPSTLRALLQPPG